MVSAEKLPLVKQKPKPFYNYIVVASFLIMTLTYGAMYTFSVFFEPLLDDFGWTRAMTSGAFSMFMVFHGFLYIITGRLNDRFGPRVLLTICGFFLGLGYLLMAQISAIWHLYLVYGVIISIGVSGAFVPIVSTIARWFVKRRALMTGIVVSGVGVGTMAIPKIASWLIYSYGWRDSYVIVGAVIMVVLMLVAQFLRRDPRQVGLVPYGEDEVDSGLGVEPSGESGFSLSSAIRTRQFWLLCIAWSGFLYCIQVIMVHVVIYARGLDISPANAANIMLIIGLFSIFGRLSVGSVADRFGIKRTLITGMAVLAITLFWLAGVREIWAVYLFAFVFGFTYGGLVPLSSPMVAELFGLRAHGAILGVITFSATVGGALGPVVAGYMYDVTGSYQQAFLIGAGVVVAAALLTAFLKPTTSWEGSIDREASV